MTSRHDQKLLVKRLAGLALERICAWYNGTPKTFIHENDPSSRVFIMPTFYTEYHWTARLAHTLVEFYLKHWQWLWTTIIAAGALLISVAALAPGRP